MPGKPLASILAKLRDDGPPDAPAALPDETPASIVDPQGFLALIEMMRECGRYDFADKTLTGIYDTVARVKFVTQAQHSAVLNIRHSIKNWEDALDD